MPRPVTLVGCLASLVLAAAGAMACGKSAPRLMKIVPPEEPLSCNTPFQPVLDQGYSGAERQFRVIGDQVAWCSLWEEVYRAFTSPPPCDTSLIDFGREVALVAGMGGAPSGCYGIAVTCVHHDETTLDLLVYVTEAAPGPPCICTLSLTNPLTVVKVSRPIGNATFISRNVTLDCS